MVYWRGDASSPITGNVLTGTFRLPGKDLTAFGIKFYLEDYGGSSSAVNSIFRELNVLSGQHNTEIIYF